MSPTISDLRDCPGFFDTVADRVWRAWWEPEGYALDDVSGRLRRSLNGDPIPFALVAHADGEFLGSTLAIESDLTERPQYTPWVAAVWVEPHHRRKAIGRMLVDRAAQACFRLGYRRIYLCASLERRLFYMQQGWVPIEEDVGPDSQTVFIRDAGAS